MWLNSYYMDPKYVHVNSIDYLYTFKVCQKKKTTKELAPLKI